MNAFLFKQFGTCQNCITAVTHYSKVFLVSKKFKVFLPSSASTKQIQKTLTTSFSSMENSFSKVDVTDAVVQHLNTPQFQSIFSEGLRKLQQIFCNHNYELRLCGGAVRDILLGNEPQDLDFATVATPDEMISMFNNEEIRLINETGWGHGTVTCRIAEENFEITTLRIDKVTDGRRALVEYTTDWKTDASRRDLTVNSMFMTLDGYVVDYFGGIEDLKNREIKFVGDPKTRIMEDYLRILRYFRFFGRIANENSEFDNKAIETICQNSHGLNNVAGERIQVEMERIFMGKHMVKVVKKLHECGLFPIIGLPQNADLDEFERVYNCTKNLDPHYMTYVTALLSNENDLDIYHTRVKFSKLHVNIARFILKHRCVDVEPSKLQSWYVDVLVEYDKQLGFKHKSGSMGSRINYFLEFLKYRGDANALEYFQNFRIPKFPVKGYDVKDKTGTKGKDVGLVLNMLYQLWKESRYTATTSELLEQIDENTVKKLHSIS